MVKAKKLTMPLLFAVLIFIQSPPDMWAAQVLFTPELIASGEYNDNINLDPENEEDDFITSAGLGLTGELLGRTAGLVLYYRPTFNSYAYNARLNFWRHEVNLRVYDQLTRYSRFEITGSFLDTENPRDRTQDLTPNDPTQGPGIDPDLNRRGRSHYQSYNAGATFNHQFGSRDDLNLGVNYSGLIGANEDEDYTDLAPFVGLEYWFVQRWGMELSGSYSIRDYDARNDRDEYTGYVRLLHAFHRRLTGYLEYRHTVLNYDRDVDPTIDPDYVLYEPSIGVRYEFQENARLTLSVGYLFQEIEGVDEVDDYGWLVNSDIVKRWNFSTNYLELSAGSGYQIADRGVSDLGLNIYYTGRVTVGRNFTQRFSGEIFGSYLHDEYPNEVPDRTDQVYNAGGLVRYQALQWLSVELTYRYTDFQSDVESDEYVENSAILSLSVSPRSAFRLN